MMLKRMPKSQLKKSSVSWKRLSKEQIHGSASKSLKVTIYRKATYYKQNHFVRYCLKSNNLKDHRGKAFREHFSKKNEKNNGNTKPKYTSLKKTAIETVPTFLGLPLEVSPPPSPTYSCEAVAKFDCYDFPMSWDENETIEPFKNGRKRATPILDSVSDLEDFKCSPMPKKKTGAKFVNNTLELKNPVKKVYENECKWCLKLFYTKKSENIFCKKCNKLKDGDADKKKRKKVKWKIINTKFEGVKEPLKSSKIINTKFEGVKEPLKSSKIINTKFEGEKDPVKSSKVTNGDSKSSRRYAKAMGKEKFKSAADTKTLSKKKRIKSSETNCDIVINQKDINATKTVRNKSKASPKILGGKKRNNKDTNVIKTVESNFKAEPKIVGYKKIKKSLKSTGDSLRSQKDNCDIENSEDLGASPIQIAKIERTWGNAVNVEKILSGIYQLTFPSDVIEIDYESLDVHTAEVETTAEDPKVPLSRVSHMHTQFPYNVSHTKDDKEEQNRVSKTVIEAKEELEAISLLAYLDMDDDIHQVLRNLDKTEYKKYRQMKRNRDLHGNRGTNTLFEKRVRLQQRKLKTLTIANTLLQTHGTFTKLAETIMGQIPSEIIEDSISPNNEYIALPCNLNYDMHTSQEQLKSAVSEPLTFPTAEVNLENSRCITHVPDNLEIKNCVGNLVLATSSAIFAMPYSTPQPVVEDSSFPAKIEASSFPTNVDASTFPANVDASSFPANIDASSFPANIEASVVPRNVETERFEASHSLPENILSSLHWTTQPFAPQSEHEVNESRHTPSTGCGSGMPSRPESARLELDFRQGTPFGAIEDNMAHTTANCIVQDCQTRSPASRQFSQSETDQVLQRVVRRKKGGFSQNAISLEIHNHLNLQTALLYEMNQQQNHQPFNQIQSLPEFHTFSAHGQFFPHVHDQMQTTALTHSHQQMPTSSLPTYQHHFNELPNHIEASQLHPRLPCQSAVTDLPSVGHGQCNISYNIESLTNDVTIGNRHFVNAQPCVPPPNHLQTVHQASTYNVLEPYTSTQYIKQAKTYNYDKLRGFLGLG